MLTAPTKQQAKHRNNPYINEHELWGIGSDEERWRLHLLYLFDGPPVPGVSVRVHLSHRYALKQQGIGGDSFAVVAVFLLSREVLHHGALLMNIDS
jgi:hypothetical protein